MWYSLLRALLPCCLVFFLLKFNNFPTLIFVTRSCYSLWHVIFIKFYFPALIIIRYASCIIFLSNYNFLVLIYITWTCYIWIECQFSALTIIAVFASVFSHVIFLSNFYFPALQLFLLALLPMSKRYFCRILNITCFAFMSSNIFLYVIFLSNFNFSFSLCFHIVACFFLWMSINDVNYYCLHIFACFSKM